MNVDPRYAILSLLLSASTFLVVPAQDPAAVNRTHIVWTDTLYDQCGEPVLLDRYQGKVILMDFWYTGCTACSYFFQHTLRDVEDGLRDLEDIVFISVAADRSQQTWLASVSSGKYTSPHAINLFTGPIRHSHPLLQRHGIDRYPTIMVIDKQGKIQRFFNGAKKPSSAEFSALLTSLL